MYKRVHLYPNPEDLKDAAIFLVHALLISNNVRRDTIAGLYLRNKWIITYGDKVRQLRPDADSSEGWLRAVLKGKRLGAIITDSPHIPDNAEKIIIVNSRVSKGRLSLPLDVHFPIILCYANDIYNCNLQGRWRQIQAPAWQAWRSVIALNIMLDRLEHGQPPIKC